MNLILSENRRVINPSNPLFNQFPLPAVAAVDTQTVLSTGTIIPRRASGIVVSPNHVLSAGHVGFDLNFNTPRFPVRATTSANQINLNSRNIGTPGDPPPNIVNSYFIEDFPTTRETRDDIILFKTSNNNPLLPESQVVGLIAFVNLRSAINLTIETAGYPLDNVLNNIPNNSGQQGRDLVLSPGDGSIGTIAQVKDQRRFFYSPTVDTGNGHSGSGVWHSLDGDQPRVLGVHNVGSGSPEPILNTQEIYNSGVLITKNIYDEIISQIKDDSGTANADQLPENAIIGTNPFFFLDGNDEILGTYRRERIIGNGGDDTLAGGGADDRLEGGVGTDEAVFSDLFENYDIDLIDDSDPSNLIFEVNHTGGSGYDAKDTLKSIEFARFSNSITPLPLEDGVEDRVSIEIPSTETNINPNDPPTPTHLALASPISMLDGDVEYTVNYSIIPQDTQYNIAFIIDTSNSMETAELQATKDAYINLTNYFIDNEIAENSNFAVINFSRYATLNANLTADEAIATIQGLTASTNPIEGTKYTDALDKAFQFFTQSPLDLSSQNNIAFFTADGKSQHDFSDPNDESYVFNARDLRGVANVQAFGIDDGSFGTVTQSQLDFVDSDNGVIVSDASELTETFGKSGLIDNIDTIDILKDGEVIQTIQANELTDSPLGVSFEGTIDDLDVSLDAENIITAQASFADGTSSPGSDFIVASGLTPSDVDPLTNIANGSSGNDEIALDPLDLGAKGGAGDDSIVANNYSNILNGGEGNDTILGHGGNDTITPGNGRDRVNGGEGIDTVVYENKQFATTAFSQVGKITNVDGTDTLTNVEFIQFSDARISAETLEVVPILSGSNITVIEGNSGNTIVQFTLNLDTPAPVNIRFDYTTVDGDAIAGADYLANSGQVAVATLAAGETSVTVPVEIIGDTIFELDESFGLTLSNISGATFADNATEYTLIANIENDDIEPLDPTSCNPTTGDDDLSDCANSGNNTINGLEGNDTINLNFPFDKKLQAMLNQRSR